jgi:hypothetical protein
MDLILWPGKQSVRSPNGAQIERRKDRHNATRFDTQISTCFILPACAGAQEMHKSAQSQHLSRRWLPEPQARFGFGLFYVHKNAQICTIGTIAGRGGRDRIRHFSTAF